MILIEDNDKNENNDVVKDQAKQMLKKMGKIVAKKSVIILIPIIIGLLLISAMTWFIVKDDGTWTDKETGNPSTYTKNVKLSGTDGISIDKMELIKKGLSNMGYTNEKIESMDESEIIRILQMNMKLNKTVTSIEGCTIAEILWCINSDYSKYLKKPEDLEYLLNAEIVTQYPKIDGIADDKLNGIIEFARVSDLEDTNDDGVINIDDKPQKITYISQEDFDTKFQNYIDSGDKEVFNYYTLDESENVIIATWSEEDGNFESNNTALQSQQKIKGGHTESTIQSEYDERYKVNENTTEKITASYVTYSAIKKPINYKSNVQKYTLPFEYLWALLVMGESDKFVLNLAELAYNSQIVVGIYDSVTTTVNVNTHNYTENFREKDEEKNENGIIINSTEWTNPPESYPYFETNTITTKYDDVQYDIMYANVWIVEVISNYKKIQTPDNYPPIESTDPDGYWTDNGTKTSRRTHSKPKKDANGNVIGTTKYYTYITHFKQKKTTGQSYKTTQNIYYDKYEKVETKVKEKTDIDPNTDMNFVKLLRADQNANTMLFKPINIIWLSDILADNADTANMIELTKYLINKAKNPDDTSLSFDFSIFEPGSFTQLYGGISGIDGIPGQIYNFLLSKGVPPVGAAAILGNIEGESSFRPDAVNSIGASGLCQWMGNRLNNLKQLAESQGKDWTDVDVQLEYMWKELEMKPSVKEVITNATEEDDLEYATWYWGRYFEIFFLGDSFEQTKSNTTVRYGYAQKWYNEWQEHKSNTESLLLAADQLHQAQKDWVYSQSSTALYSGNIEKSINNPNKATCCATYVSSALYMSGYVSEQEINSINYNSSTSLYKLLHPRGWGEITSYDELQPGDIVFTKPSGDRFGHVQIYAGDNTWYNAGSNDSIKGGAPLKQNESRVRAEFGVALRPE